MTIHHIGECNPRANHEPSIEVVSDIRSKIPIVWLESHQTISGWWYTYPSEKYEFVSWDYMGL